MNEIAPPAIQAAVFDLDGVLMDSERIAFAVWQEWAAQRGSALPEAAFGELVGTTIEETARLVMLYTGLVFDVAESSAWVWQAVTERLTQQIEALPGAGALVRRLAEAGLPLAIASNSVLWYIDNALNGLGLAEFFAVRVGIDQVEQGKPAPDVYLQAAQRLGVDTRACVAFEDSRVGLQAALAAGMRAVAIPNPYDSIDGFEAAWRVYPDLLAVSADLAAVLGADQAAGRVGQVSNRSRARSAGGHPG